jgi:hypothetical protein
MRRQGTIAEAEDGAETKQARRDMSLAERKALIPEARPVTCLASLDAKDDCDRPQLGPERMPRASFVLRWRGLSVKGLGTRFPAAGRRAAPKEPPATLHAVRLDNSGDRQTGSARPTGRITGDFCPDAGTAGETLKRKAVFHRELPMHSGAGEDVTLLRSSANQCPLGILERFPRV